MVDRYNSFDELARDMLLGRDYRIETVERPGSDFLIIAPHGGKIEKGTSELTRAIAGADFSFYSFEGVRAAGNRGLHITSHKFDEPTALKLAGRSRKVVGIHGRRNGQDNQTAYLGGLDERLVNSIKLELSNSGFPAVSGKHDFPATNPQNICNIGTSGSGVQLELPLDLRMELLESEIRMRRFATAVRTALLR
ncbi:MAG: poly-gamma-glutamate hydrolase family protein [Hyphomonadaceae bacterium]|nr:poly-gamma-glutamate hydrolase family protein [Hyphomonadaceae bacterium]